MKIKAQFAMVMNLDKCIGCHTCSVTCNNTWTNRQGAEYMWWNNVETKPGVGYPIEWENQEKMKGGWRLANGKLELLAGGRLKKLLNIFHNPDLVPIEEYYHPWTYDYENLIDSPLGRHQPVGSPKSLITGRPMQPQWGPNWEDDLGGVHVTGRRDPNLLGLEQAIRLEYEQVFMMYLPRICEHCLNPSCVASCPSGAIYKRDEDGIVLVDQEMRRGWRFCTTGCPYKKVYFNWKTHKAEKCIFCYPRLETGMTTICSESCVGRLRYIGLILYDSDRVQEMAAVTDQRQLYKAQLSLYLDPSDPDIEIQARRDGIADDWINAAKESPVYKLVVKHGLALPIHPEFRTLPMVWYLPTLSPVLKAIGQVGANPDAAVTFADPDAMRIPLQYLANILTAGDIRPVRSALRKMTAIRQYMRSMNILGRPDEGLLRDTGLDEASAQTIYRLLAVAKYADRFVIPTAHKERIGEPYSRQGTAGMDLMESCSACFSRAKDR